MIFGVFSSNPSTCLTCLPIEYVSFMEGYISFNPNLVAANNSLFVLRERINNILLNLNIINYIVIIMLIF